MARLNGVRYFAVYEVSRCYGGPEEGGWWYDDGRVLGAFKLRRSELCVVRDKRWRTGADGRMVLQPYERVDVRPDAMRRLEKMAARDFGYLPVKPRGYRGRGSVIGGPDIEVRVMSCVPYDYPAQRPHYE